MERWFLRPGAIASAAGQLAAFAGGVHLVLAQQHFHDSTVIGWLFVANGTGLLVTGAWLILTGKVWAWRAAGTIAAATVLAYLVSRIVGLPGLHHEAFEIRGIVTSSIEALVAISALAAGLLGDRPPKPQQDPAWLLALAARQR